MAKNDRQKTIATFMVVIFVASIFVAAAGYFSSSNNGQSSNSQQPNSQAGNETATIAKYKEQLANNPQDVNAMVALGNAYYDQQNYRQAINYYEASLKFESDHPHVLVDLGTAYYYQANSNPKKAIEVYNKALELDPKFKNALFNKGVVLHFGLQDYQKSIKAFEVFLEKYPNGELANKAKQFITEAKKTMK
ncbi:MULTISPECIES: tetratricopeptide repeat protein [unclassified Candidatus Frackibacter]|uniref:tetratricopeptide repeat protein n=1 Tax=unclassified Candidatus Frackibacter TaxID=2648818 RepID=UPI00087FBB71|nr:MULTISPECIES: tetratricopeptide repeat protein [unclassified Candidatus Frackibacter]SDC81161.1 Tetratricopeptide repeat-containing protein [Candidatus Frackibacter sp. WG11]SFM02353.1 Tetratricopeptide repeat-containing protein [Candidatus Frackibacter sp. WG13]